MDLIKEIKWKLFMLKVKLTLVSLEAIEKYMRKNYCRYGIHKLKSSYVGYGGSNQRMKHIRFLTCRFCNYKFFAKKSDKERYLEHEQKAKEMFSALLEHPSSGKPN